LKVCWSIGLSLILLIVTAFRSVGYPEGCFTFCNSESTNLPAM